MLPVRWPRLVTLGSSISFWRTSASYWTDFYWKPWAGLGQALVVAVGSDESIHGLLVLCAKVSKPSGVIVTDAQLSYELTIILGVSFLMTG